MRISVRKSEAQYWWRPGKIVELDGHAWIVAAYETTVDGGARVTLKRAAPPPGYQAEVMEWPAGIPEEAIRFARSGGYLDEAGPEGWSGTPNWLD